MTNEINGSLIVKIPAEEPFYISQTPVTIAQYKRCVKEGKCVDPHYRDEFSKFYFFIFYSGFPVSFVTWDEAKNYCQSYGGDLPTSVQWMIAAGNNKYPWGNTEPTLSKANIDGWYQSQLPAGWLSEGKSEYGILDMSGNVREWVLDENENGEKELKGGGFQDAWRDSEVEANFFHEKSSPGFNRGFRCVFPAK